MRYGHNGHGPYLSVSEISKCPYLGHTILGYFSDNYVSSDVIKQQNHFGYCKHMDLCNYTRKQDSLMFSSTVRA